MVEEDAVTGIHPVALSVVPDDMKCECLRTGIGTAWVKRRRFGLRRFENLAEEFAGARLVEPRRQFRATKEFEEAHDSHACHVARVLRNIKANADVRLRREVVDLVGTDLHKDP